jgi:hypothetical protein
VAISYSNMSLIFGGKLLAPKQKRSAHDPSDFDASKSVQLLSKREQELLEELQKTRTDIVRELVRVSPQIRTDDLDSWKSSIKKYQSNLSSSKKVERPLTSLEAKRHFRRRSEIQASKTLQSLPIMSSTGEFAFGFKTKRDDSVALPVLTLPAVRIAQIHSSVPQSDIHPREITSNTSPPVDSKFSLNFDQFGVNFMINYFSISQSQWDEIITNFDKVCRYVQPSFEEPNDNENFPTVFMSVSDRYCDFLCSDFSTSDRPQNNRLALSLPPINPTQNQSNSTGTSIFASSKQPNMPSKRHVERGKPLSKTKKRLQSQRSMPTESSPNNLRQELMSSLGQMQRYTAEVCLSFLL